MTARSANLIVLALSAMSVTFAVAVARARLVHDPSSSSGSQSAIRTTARWQRFGELGSELLPSKRRGDSIIQSTPRPSHSVQVTVFSDFECPHSARLATSVRAAQAHFGPQVRVSFRHNPLTWSRPNAWYTALAASCADEQSHFSEFHDSLFASRLAQTSATLEGIAHSSGVSDIARFNTCLRESRTSKRVEQDTIDARALGLRRTPAFLVDSVIYVGDPGRDSLFEILGRALRRPHRPFS
jgi:protein-disulfide isomerase